MADAPTDEAQLQAEAFKVQGNALLADKQYRDAVEMYSRAIDLDPDNAVYYSNRSAAYLALGDERGNALRDADKCIALRPDWWKGYSRKGAAEHALQRFDAARATYQLGLTFDPDNASLLQAAEDAYAAGQDHSQRLREAARTKAEEAQRRKASEMKAAESEANQNVSQTEKVKPVPADVNDEDALLAVFMSEVHELEESANCIQKEEKPAERTPVDFGDADGQLARLLQDHYEWINLNPFRVLMLETDATEEDIKQHYRKISTLVHPDKCRHPRAREAFEQVTKAHDTLLNDDRRKTFVRLIANTRERVDKERRQKLKKGIVKPSELGDLSDEQDKAVIKAFAEMEHRRVNLEKREAAQKRREADQQEKQQQQTVDMFKRERSWADEDRRENRVGNWRDFQKGGKRRKEMDAQGRKEERSDEKKFGVVENDQYKKNWK